MGHLGDLPVLVVDKDGKATTPVIAPRLKNWMKSKAGR
jgi:Cu-Zn family superoxide dismutase